MINRRIKLHSKTILIFILRSGFVSEKPNLY